MFQVGLAYVLIAGFFAIEIFLRQGTSAKSLEVTDSDKGSTLLIGASFGVAVALPPLLNALQVGQITWPIVDLARPARHAVWPWGCASGQCASWARTTLACCG